MLDIAEDMGEILKDTGNMRSFRSNTSNFRSDIGVHTNLLTKFVSSYKYLSTRMKFKLDIQMCREI